MLIFVPLWQFFFCVTLCNLTNCLFGHKISLPVQVWLDRFHCIHYYRMQIFIQNMTLLLYSDIHISVSAYHIFKFSRHVYFIKKKIKLPVHTILKTVHSYVVLVIKTCGGGDTTPAVTVTVQERFLHPSTPHIGECHITSTRGNTEKHSNLHPHSFNSKLEHTI